MPKNANCQRCSLHQTTSNVCVWSSGYGTGKIMLVGEAPGASEERDGLPFVGAAGRVLDEILGKVGLTRDDLIIANTVKCRPPSNREPTREESAACLPYLLEEIETYQPRVIVCMGNAALKTLTGLNAIGKARGRVLSPIKGLRISAPIMATYHPAAVLYQRSDIYPLLLADFEGFAGSSSEDVSGIELFPYDPMSEKDHATCTALGNLEGARVLACDLEWSAGSNGEFMFPWTPRAEAYSIAITGRVDGMLRSVAIGLPVSENVRTALTRVLTKPVGFHNAISDLVWARSVGLNPALAFDTLILSHLINEEWPRTLEALAIKYAGADPNWKRSARTIRSSRPNTTEEWLDVLRYNALDTQWTLLTMEGMLKYLSTELPDRKDKILRLHSKVVLRAIPPLVEAELSGVPIDVPLLLQERQLAEQRLVDAANELAGVAGVTPKSAIKLARSHEQVKDFVEGTFGIKLANTQKGEMSRIAEYPAVKLIGRIRREDKMLSTYLRPWSTMLARQGDGRLHSVYKPAGTRTGRLSAELETKGNGASLQQMPRNDKDLKFRRMVRARPGYLILSCDYSQLELRLIAWVSNERKMLDIYQNEKDPDLHRFLAAYFLAAADNGGYVPVDQFMAERYEWESRVTKADRDPAKSANFGLVYGMKDAKLQTYARTNFRVVMSDEQTRMVSTSYFRLFPTIKSWQEHTLADAASRGYQETPFGRRRHFVDPNDVHAALNFPVQSPGSDLTLLAMANAYDVLKAEHLDTTFIGEVHDSILQEVSERDADRARELTVYCMENVDTTSFGFKLPIRTPADWKLAETWSED